MNFRSPFFASGALLFLSFALAGWKTAGPSSTSGTLSASSQAAANSKTARPGKRTGIPDDVALQMDAIRHAPNTAERLRATVALANSLPIADIEKWLSSGWFNVRGGYELIMFNSIVRERWLAATPDQMARWQLKNRDLESCDAFIHWAKKDRDGFTNFMLSESKSDNVYQALGQVAQTDATLALECFQKLIANGVSQNAQSYSGTIFQALAKSSPAQLEQMLPSLPPSLRNRAETFLEGAKLNASFSSEIRELWQRDDGWKIFNESANYNGDFPKKILSELKNLPDSWKSSIASGNSSLIYNNAADWLHADLEGAGFTAEQAKNLRAQALGYMSGTDPMGVLQTMRGMDLDDNQRRNVIANLFANLAQDSDKASEALKQLDNDEDRKTAQQYIDQRNQQTGKQSPAEWIEKISALDLSSSDRSQYYSLSYRNWTPENIEELRSNFSGLPTDSKTKIAQVLVSRGGTQSLGNEFTGELLAYLAAQPEQPKTSQNIPFGNNIDYSVSNYVVNLGEQNPDEASTWLQTLPDGKAKTSGQKNLAALWMQYDPDAANRWIQTLPDNVRSDVLAAAKKQGRR